MVSSDAAKKDNEVVVAPWDEYVDLLRSAR